MEDVIREIILVCVRPETLEITVIIVIVEITGKIIEIKEVIDVTEMNIEVVVTTVVREMNIQEEADSAVIKRTTDMSLDILLLRVSFYSNLILDLSHCNTLLLTLEIFRYYFTLILPFYWAPPDTTLLIGVTLYVGNLDRSINEADLREMFEVFGRLTHSKLIMDRRTR